MDHEPPPTATGLEAMPAALRSLALTMLIQAFCYLVSALAASIAYLVFGPDTLNLGAYATGRTHPATMIVIGLGVAGLLLWLTRRLTLQRPGTYRLINITELVLVLDGVVGLLFGIFNLWWVIGLLASLAALWVLHSRHSDLELS